MTSTTAGKRGYHHGELRSSLLAAAVELARASGPDAVTLREVSRRADVSHNAGYRHYADRDALLDAVADVAFDLLAATMRDLLATVPTDDPVVAALLRLSAAGRGYLQFAQAEPGLFLTAFRRLGRAQHGVVISDRGNPYQMLCDALDGMVDAGLVDPARRPGMETVAWAAVHGLAMLFVDGPLRAVSPADRAAMTEQVLAAVCRGLLDDPERLS